MAAMIVTIAVAAASGIAFAAGPVPKARFAFVSGGKDNNVVQFKVKSNGTLLANSPATVATNDDFPGSFASSKRQGKTYVYVANQNGTTISEFTLGAGGKLIPLNPASYELGFSPAFPVVDPRNRFLYVTTFGPRIEQLKINPNGTLTANSPSFVTVTGGSTNFPVIDPKSNFLFVTDFGHKTVAQFRINSDGTLTPNVPASIATGGNPRRIAITPTGKFAYVPNLDDGTISQYIVNADGTLTPNNPATVQLPAGSGPFQIVIGPNSNFAIVIGDNMTDLEQFTIAANGTLTPNTPAAFPLGIFPGLMALDPGGRYAFIDDFASTVYELRVSTNGAISATSASAGAGEIATVTAGHGNREILLLK